MSDPSECALSIAAMVKDWYESPHKSDIPATLIDRRMARFQPPQPLAALAMRERAAAEVVTAVPMMHHMITVINDVTSAIRAIPTDFTDAELLAAAIARGAGAGGCGKGNQ